jgi:hypothetical protein
MGAAHRLSTLHLENRILEKRSTGFGYRGCSLLARTSVTPGRLREESSDCGSRRLHDVTFPNLRPSRTFPETARGTQGKRVNDGEPRPLGRQGEHAPAVSAEPVE